MIEISAFAKINLFLDIQGKRADGYHDIISVMQSVDWCDKLRIEKNTQKKIILVCSTPDIPTDERNTVYKAAKLFLDKAGLREGVSITLDKHIPHEAGMAGGSADAAATLKGMNRLFGAPFSVEELLSMGKSIGADVPFCLVGGTRLVEGIGEKISDFPIAPPCYILCAKEGDGVSTPVAYRTLDTKYGNFEHYQPRWDLLKKLSDSFSEGKHEKSLFNIFENVVESERPLVTLLKKTMYEHGALVAMMSGSGPSVFGVFDDLSLAQKAESVLKKSGTVCRVCKPLCAIDE